MVNWRPSRQTLAEFHNPTSQPVRLIGPDNKQVSVPAYGKMILSDFFLKFTPNKLLFVRYVSPRPLVKQKPLGKSRPAIKRAIPAAPAPKAKPQSMPVKPNDARKPIVRRVGRTIRQPERNWRSRTVGRSVVAGADAMYEKVASNSCVPISNNIGIGILSYNRFDSLKRLLLSIKAHTNLKRTTIFVSDESDNLTQDQRDWLNSQDICVMLTQPRLGVAGNTNRLFKCLDRFKWKIILNDDVEILKDGWEQFYVDAMAKTGIQHFCYREPGVYGASENDGVEHQVSGVPVMTIHGKPHGAVMALTHTAFEAVGYFDEGFGTYGMEHVDWSTRVSRKFGVSGFHDVIGASAFFQIHAQPSAAADRLSSLGKARERFAAINKDDRIYIQANSASDVPAISVVIPFKDQGRSDDVETVIANLKSQKFPRIEIIIAEQDTSPKAPIDKCYPITHISVPNTTNFNKAMAFNNGVLKAKYDKIILHDADIIVSSDYAKAISDALNSYESCHLGAEVYYLSTASTDKLNNQHTLQPDYECGKVVTYFEGGSLGCTKTAYYKIGGFDEKFEGYGVEDCAFYANLNKSTKLLSSRTFKFFHLWHDRVVGWEACHARNKTHYTGVTKSDLQVYISQLAATFKAKYQS